VSTCRSCDAEVVFVPSAKTGKPMILDAEPKKGVVLRWDDVGTYGDRLGEGDHNGKQVGDVLTVYTDHHATCPNAGDWKGRTRATAPA
jgi:hypothetical protein